MRLKPRAAWFLAFTAAFAVLAGFVFWGTWSLDVAPVMPDAALTPPVGYWDGLTRAIRAFNINQFHFIPDDLLILVGTEPFRQELFYVFCLYAAALALVYYCRGRGLSRAASYAAGLFLGFCGYWSSLYAAGHGSWFRWMVYGVFAFGLCDRAVRRGKRRHWLMLGAVLAWAAHWQPDLWLIFAILTAAYFVWCCVRERRWPNWRGVGLAAAAFLLIGSVSIWDAFASSLARRQGDIAGEHADGAVLTGGAGRTDEEAKWIFTTNWSMPPEDTLEFFNARVHGDTSCPFTLCIGPRLGTGVRPYTGRLGRPYGADRGNYRQHSLYVGWVTCLLALFAVARGLLARWRTGRGAPAQAAPSAQAAPTRRPTDLWFFAVAALVLWLLSMGRYCEPVYRLVFHLPLVSFIRAPVKWHHATEFCLVVLAAHGVDALWRLPAAEAKRWVRPLILAFVLVGACDLARIDHFYCAPVDVREARRHDLQMDMTFLQDADFRNPQVAAMVRARRILPLADHPGRRDVHLVGVLSPRKPPEPQRPFPPWVRGLGLLSVLCTLAVSAYSIRKS